MSHDDLEGSEENGEPGNGGGGHSGNSLSDDQDIVWSDVLDEKHGKNWTQMLELTPDARAQPGSGPWTLYVDGEQVVEAAKPLASHPASN